MLEEELIQQTNYFETKPFPSASLGRSVLLFCVVLILQHFAVHSTMNGLIGLLVAGKDCNIS